MIYRDEAYAHTEAYAYTEGEAYGDILVMHVSASTGLVLRTT